MKKQIITLLFLTLTSSIYAQNWYKNKVKGDGNVITKEKNIDAFNVINVSGSFEVHFSNELSNSLKITTDKNLIDDIITEVVGGTLKIKAKKNVYLKPSNKRIKILIPHKDVEKVTLSGSGIITNTTPIESPTFHSNISGSGKIRLRIDTDKASLNVSGSGRIEIQGKTEELHAKVSGSGAIKAKDFQSENGKLNLSGSGHMEVQCTENLEAMVSGSGSIRYYGEPKSKIDTKVSGSGSIRKANE